MVTVLEYLSTDEMVADVLTKKPLQGEKFQQFIKRIMHTIEDQQ